MALPVKLQITLSQELFAQVEVLVHQLGVSRMQFFEQAVSAFITSQGISAAPLHPAVPTGQPRRIRQGDIYWLQRESSDGQRAGIPHPHVVIQDDALNDSRLETTVVIALTTNLRRLNMPGNILLDDGEAHLPKQSIVEVSKVSSVDKALLGAFIGQLDARRIQQILGGLRLIQHTFYKDE